MPLGAQNDDEFINTWTGWPPRPILSLYGKEGVLLSRSRSRRLDLADTVGPFISNGKNNFYLGLKSDSTVLRYWTEENLRAQEQNIRYDLSHNGFEFWLFRIKGASLRCSEEAIWRIEFSL